MKTYRITYLKQLEAESFILIDELNDNTVGAGMIWSQFPGEHEDAI